jgi:rare lipoprotein A
MAIDVLCRIRSLATVTLLGLLLAGCASGSGRGSYGSGSGTYTVGSPYEENGIWYYPAVDYNYDRTGTASWYGADFDGKYTANGETYDMNQLTAAHTTLPLPSIVQVTDLQNGRTLQLRVNDRGPFIGGRVIDVSRRAAQLLGFETKGTAPVRVKVLKQESIATAEQAMRNSGRIMVAGAASVSAATPSSPRAAVEPAPMPMAAAGPGITQSPAPVLTAQAAMPPSAAAPEPEIVAGSASASEMPPSSSISVAVSGGPSGRLYIQAGAFSLRDNAQRVQLRIAGLGAVRVTTTSVNGIEMYRVRLGPIENTGEADRLLARVVDSGYPGARLVGD